MLVSDILRSCAHQQVAAAAIKSIGGDFAASVQRRAEGEGLSLGDFAAEVVMLRMMADDPATATDDRT